MVILRLLGWLNVLKCSYFPGRRGALVESFLRPCPAGLRWLLSLTSLMDVVLVLFRFRDGMLPESPKKWQWEDSR